MFPFMSEMNFEQQKNFFFYSSGLTALFGLGVVIFGIILIYACACNKLVAYLTIGLGVLVLLPSIWFVYKFYGPSTENEKMEWAQKKIKPTKAQMEAAKAEARQTRVMEPLGSKRWPEVKPADVGTRGYRT
jgi:hypothetical protein